MNSKEKRRGIYRISKRYSLIRIRRRAAFTVLKNHQRKKYEQISLIGKENGNV